MEKQVFLIEEYLVLIVVAIFAGAVGSAALLVALLLAGEADLLDRIVAQGSVLSAPHWLRFSLLMRANERWRKSFLTPADGINLRWRKLRGSRLCPRTGCPAK